MSTLCFYTKTRLTREVVRATLIYASAPLYTIYSIVLRALYGYCY